MPGWLHGVHGTLDIMVTVCKFLAIQSDFKKFKPKVANAKFTSDLSIKDNIKCYADVTYILYAIETISIVVLGMITRALRCAGYDYTGFMLCSV